MKAYDWIVFDLDGTLVRSDRGIINCMRQVFSSYGVDVSGVDMTAYIGPPLTSTLAHFLGDKADEAIEQYRALYAEKGTRECELYPGVRNMLEALRGGYHLAVASAKIQRAAELVLTYTEIIDFFDCIVGSLPDGSRSHKVESICCVLEQTGADPNRVLMVGDRDLDLIGAEKAGVRGLGVLYGYGPRDELERCSRIALAETAADVVRILAGETAR